jgi:hypothetical protein
MCYELRWLRWKRATEAARKREQLETVSERASVKSPPAPIEPAAQSDPAPKVQEELEPV